MNTTEISVMDYWYSVVHGGNSRPEFIENMFALLKGERPPILSVVGERACDLQCSHCLFQKERSSQGVSRDNSLTTAVTTILSQMEPVPIVIHEGRVFRPRHLEWLQAIRETRSDAKVGMIDSGAYLNHVGAIDQSGFRFDWLDISLDGDGVTHNLQRQSQSAFRLAINGMENAGTVLGPLGRLTSLFTLTTINFNRIGATCDVLPEKVGEWHITTISPVRPEIKHLSVADEQFAVAWEQIVAISQIRPVFVRIYVAEDMLKLARVVGKDSFMQAMKRARVSTCSITLSVDDVPVTYYPQSVATSETFVIDADCYYRIPYSLAYTLKELQGEVSRFGEDLSVYTIGRVTADSQFGILHGRGVDVWKSDFGREALDKELSVFNAIKQL